MFLRNDIILYKYIWSVIEGCITWLYYNKYWLLKKKLVLQISKSCLNMQSLSRNIQQQQIVLNF